MNLPIKEKQTHRHREQPYGCQVGGIGSLGLADANYYIQNGQSTWSYCITQGSTLNIP